MEKSLIYYFLLIFGIILISVGSIFKLLKYSIGPFRGVHFVLLGLLFAFIGIFLNKYFTKE
ncbi:MAG: hypothetical protein CR989_04360 [Flavobacteriales bacterium]|nr:MAG: hypothetical protein CR989_04360 [Flavobacteriales bacterium]